MLHFLSSRPLSVSRSVRSLWLGHGWIFPSMYLICIFDHMPVTVMVLTPHVVLISAAVCPLWQMVTIISHNSVNTETWSELQSEALFTPEADRTLSNVRLAKMCAFPLVLVLELMTCHYWGPFCLPWQTAAVVVLAKCICFKNLPVFAFERAVIVSQIGWWSCWDNCALTLF